jgi:hypothetical protein
LFALDVIDLRPIDGDDAENVIQSDIEDIGIEALDFAGQAGPVTDDQDVGFSRAVTLEGTATVILPSRRTLPDG